MGPWEELEARTAGLGTESSLGDFTDYQPTQQGIVIQTEFSNYAKPQAALSLYPR